MGISTLVFVLRPRSRDLINKLKCNTFYRILSFLSKFSKTYFDTSFVVYYPSLVDVVQCLFEPSSAS